MDGRVSETNRALDDEETRTTKRYGDRKKLYILWSYGISLVVNDKSSHRATVNVNLHFKLFDRFLLPHVTTMSFGLFGPLFVNEKYDKH